MADHFGRWLADRIALIPSTQEGFARASNIPLGTLLTWLQARRPGIRADNITRLALALGLDRREVIEQLQPTRVSQSAD